MGTNFYARIIPSKKRKLELASLINTEDFYKINEEIQKTFGTYGVDYDGNVTGGIVHLGKRSGGWKFLWNPNIYIIHNGHCEYFDNGNGSRTCKWIKDSNTYYYVYPLTKEGIWNFINRPNIVVYDEYNKKQDKEKFFNDAVNWTTWNGEEAWDSKTYNEWERSQNPNWITYKCSGDLIEKLISDGYKMISESNSDFYSDGLRFSTSTEFS